MVTHVREGMAREKESVCVSVRPKVEKKRKRNILTSGENGVATIIFERHRFEDVLYQGNQDRGEDQEEDDGKSETEAEDDDKDLHGKGKDGQDKGKVSKTPPPSFSPTSNPQHSPYQSPFGLQVRGRYYQPHSAITELSEHSRADSSTLEEEQGFYRPYTSPSRSFSNGSSHASDGSAKCNSNNSSTPSTLPKYFVKTPFLEPGDVSDDEGPNAGAISPKIFLKLAEGCATRNRHFRIGGPPKVEVPAVSLLFFFSCPFTCVCVWVRET